MHPRSLQTRLRRNHRDWTHRPAWLIIAVCTLVPPGCGETKRNVGKRFETKGLDQTGVAVGIDENPRPQPHAQAPVKQSGPIIGQRTTDIRDARKELQQAGARVASQKIVAKDPITVQGNAYVAIVGRTSILSIQHSMDLYKAANDRYPKDLDEFMTEIIKANGIALPQLPPYQKYAYDDKQHKLIVVEYPDLK